MTAQAPSYRIRRPCRRNAAETSDSLHHLLRISRSVRGIVCWERYIPYIHASGDVNLLEPEDHRRWRLFSGREKSAWSNRQSLFAPRACPRTKRVLDPDIGHCVRRYLPHCNRCLAASLFKMNHSSKSCGRVKAPPQPASILHEAPFHPTRQSFPTRLAAWQVFSAGCYDWTWISCCELIVSPITSGTAPHAAKSCLGAALSSYGLKT